MEIMTLACGHLPVLGQKKGQKKRSGNIKISHIFLCFDQGQSKAMSFKESYWQTVIMRWNYDVMYPVITLL